jgi:ABC-2 type transport system permease protein
MRATFVIAGRELRARVRDRTALVVAFVAPVVLAGVLSVALAGDAAFSVTIGVVDADRGPYPASILDEGLGGEQLRGEVMVRMLPDLAAARLALRRGEVGAVIAFPRGFSAGIREGHGGRIEVLRSPTAPLAGTVAESVVEGFAALVDTRGLAVRASLAAGVPQDDVRRHVEANGAAGPALTLSSDAIAGRPVDAASYFGPGMAVLFVFFVVGVAPRSLLAERRQGTLARVRAAPIRGGAILLGKALAAVVVALASVGTVWAVTTLAFGADWGDPLAVAALSGAHVLAATGVTALVGSGARTDDQADGYTALVAFVFAILGGSFVALHDLPEVVQRLALLTPNGWAMRGFAILAADGGGVASVALPVTVMLAIAAVTATLAAMRARRLVTS